MITGFDFSASRKAYCKCLSNSFKINPLELVSTSCAIPSQLLDFSALPSFRPSIVSLNSELEFRTGIQKFNIKILNILENLLIFIL